MPDVINFYLVGDDYGWLSNFGPYPVTIDSKVWPTSEHYFQAQKFAGTELVERIRRNKSPMEAAKTGRNRKNPIRRDWDSVKDAVMREAVREKFTQHADLGEKLIATGEAKIVEHTEKDSYWADGGDGSGKNMLGRILMEIRAELRSGV